MAKYGVQTKLPPEEVVKRALAFFGPGGLGLEVKESGPACARFVGGGGHVALDVCQGESGTEVDLETREWDYQVRQFMGQL